MAMREKRVRKGISLLQIDWDRLDAMVEQLNSEMDLTKITPMTRSDLIEKYVIRGMVAEGIPPPSPKEVVDQVAEQVKADEDGFAYYMKKFSESVRDYTGE